MSRKIPHNALEPEQRERILELRRAGHSFTAIANDIGCSKSTAHTICEAEGLTGSRSDGVRGPLAKLIVKKLRVEVEQITPDTVPDLAQRLKLLKIASEIRKNVCGSPRPPAPKKGEAEESAPKAPKPKKSPGQRGRPPLKLPGIG